MEEEEANKETNNEWCGIIKVWFQKRKRSKTFFFIVFVFRILVKIRRLGWYALQNLQNILVGVDYDYESRLRIYR